MHAGNIYAALASWLIVKEQGGEIVLRIEDLDRERSRQCYIDDLMRDFETLGLIWDRGPYYQSDRSDVYKGAFSQLNEQGRVYPCFCTRADLHAASAPHRGEKLVYAGTCARLTPEEVAEKSATRNPAYRLRVDEREVGFCDLIQGPYVQNLATECGDFLIKRSDGAFAYQLAVVIDDAEQGVNCIVRGVDLLCSTPQQMYLQDLLGFGHPDYAHIPLLVAERNRRLSKRDKDASLDELMARFGSAEGIIGHIAGITGLVDSCEPATPADLLERFTLEGFKSRISDPIQIGWR